MAAREARRRDGIEAVAIVTPNHTHCGRGEAFLKAGIHVICDKPLTTPRPRPKALAQLAAASGSRLRGHAQLHRLSAGAAGARDGRGGRARRHPRGPGRVCAGLARDADRGDRPEAGRLAHRPGARRGGRPVGDIGTHAFNLAELRHGRSRSRSWPPICTPSCRTPARRQRARAAAFRERRAGMLWCSQVAAGHENGLRSGLWREGRDSNGARKTPMTWRSSPLGQPPRPIRRNGAGADEASRSASRMPPGHPEGYLEGFAQLYADIAEQIAARIESREPTPGAELCRPSRTACGVSASSMPPWPLTAPTVHGLRSDRCGNGHIRLIRARAAIHWKAIGSGAREAYVHRKAVAPARANRAVIDRSK